MKIRPFLLTAAACVALSSVSVVAHEGHDDDEKLIPTTCAQLADSKRYITDVAYPEVKKLKERCDAEKASGAQASSAKN